ncbi:MAG: hypothetical protein ABJC36_10345 [Gemmatimonadales bacterium]
MTTVRSLLLRLAAWAALPVAVACGGDETQAPEDHTPVAYTVFVNGTEAAEPVILTQGQITRIRLVFTNAAGDDLDDVETEHFGGLSFEPTSLATVERVVGHNFQFDVTGGTPGTGDARVSYGHDEVADETTLTSFDVSVQGGP